MLPPFFIRSTVFNLLSYVLTGLGCVVLLPTLLLPRTVFLWVVRLYVRTHGFLERSILGLTYEVRGKENLPQTGAFLVAAKHQSAYETLKLHMLFKDPAIVLKRELFSIPLWGWYLKKSDVIAIDRSSPKAALQSIQDGAKRMAAQGRPIVIFPQGTRVNPEQTARDKPYKIGIIRMQESTDLPIIPLALNTGVFWPRHGWCKKSGRVIFEFLPPLQRKESAPETLKDLEIIVESASNALMREGRKHIPPSQKTKARLALIAFILLLVVSYTVNWFIAAHWVQKATTEFLDDLAHNPDFSKSQIAQPVITGFPARIKMTFPPQHFKSPTGELEIGELTATSWPFLGFPIDLHTGDITFSMARWKGALDFDTLDARIVYKDNRLTLQEIQLRKEVFSASLLGTMDFSVSPYPDLDLVLHLHEFSPLIEDLVEKKIIKPKAALFATMALQSLQKDGHVALAVTRQNRTIYLGPIRVFDLPETEQPPALLEDGRPSELSTRREKPSSP